MDSTQDLQNKAVAAEDAGVSGDKSMGLAQSAEKVKDDAEEDVDKLAAEAEDDAKADIADAESAVQDAEHGDLVEAAGEADGLVQKALDQAKEIADNALNDVEQLAEDVKEVVSDAVGFVKAKLGSHDPAEHDAALREQYDATHDLAARGGDSAENQ